MISTYEYRLALDGKDADAAVQAISDHGAALIRIRPFLLGVDIVSEGPWLRVTLRLTDIDRSRIAAHARKSILAMAAKARLDHRKITLRQTLIEPTARSFVAGQGRTPRPRRPRSQEPQNI